MQKFFKNCLLAGLLLIFQSCGKDVNGNGAINVAVQYQGAAVKQATVYLQMDSVYHPGSAPQPFRSAVADGSGNVSFNNIQPGRYYISAGGNSGTNQPVFGSDSITVRKRFRENTYDVIVKALPR